MREEDRDEALATRAVILIEAPRDRAVEIEHREHAAVIDERHDSSGSIRSLAIEAARVEASADRRPRPSHEPIAELKRLQRRKRNRSNGGPQSYRRSEALDEASIRGLHQGRRS
jgi:hypothetical protein